MSLIVKALLVYLAVVNTYGFLIAGWDKRCAVKGRWRVSEVRLIGTAVAGGSVGVWCAMYIFRHKTKHWYFKWGMPVLVTVQGYLLWRALDSLGFQW